MSEEQPVRDFLFMSRVVLEIYVERGNGPSQNYSHEEVTSLLNSGKYAEALFRVNPVFDLSSNDTDQRMNLLLARSWAFRGLGQFYEAREDAIAAVRLDPNRPEAHVVRGDVEGNVGQWEAALKCYKLAAVLDRENKVIKEKTRLCRNQIIKDRRRERLGYLACFFIGVVLSAGLLLGEILPSILKNNVFVKGLIVILCILISLAMFRFQLWFSQVQKQALTRPPILEFDFSKES